MAECAKGVYRPRQPRETPFYRIVEEYFERFEQVYPERYEDRYGYLRPVIRETVYTYLNCGDLKQGYARVRCRDCGHKYLLAYSCKRRYYRAVVWLPDARRLDISISDAVVFEEAVWR